MQLFIQRKPGLPCCGPEASKGSKALATVVLWLTMTSPWAASHHPQDFLKSVAGTPDEGQKIVQHYCANCHAVKPIIPLGAPRMGVAADWEPRVTQGLVTLLKHTDEGLNAMPARGGCFECTDKQLMLAVLTMLPESMKKRLSEDHSDHKKYK